MKLGTFFATAALALGLGGGAQAQQLLASDPQTFVDFFAAEGYRPELREDTVGDPMVMFRHEGKTAWVCRRCFTIVNTYSWHRPR